MVPISLLEIHSIAGKGYQPLVDFASWRVAMLRYVDELLPDKIDRMQKHNETDEVFVLLEGRCILFLGEGEDHIHSIHAQDMEPLRLYNVKQNSWHTHTLSGDATVLIVENRDTNQINSPELALNPDQKAQLIALAEKLWKGYETE